MSIELKYDGERIQLHVWPEPGDDVLPTAARPHCRRDGVAWRIFSRGGNDSTFRRSLALPQLSHALGHPWASDMEAPEQALLTDGLTA